MEGFLDKVNTLFCLNTDWLSICSPRFALWCVVYLSLGSPFCYVLLFFQPSAADFSLPGSASPDKYDSVFVNNSSASLVDGKFSSVTVPLILLCACTVCSVGVESSNQFYTVAFCVLSRHGMIDIDTVSSRNSWKLVFGLCKLTVQTYCGCPWKTEHLGPSKLLFGRSFSHLKRTAKSKRVGGRDI